jgi:site-specific recombinase XerD
MAKFMAAVAADPNQRRRLMIELLARTGMRVGEMAALEDDAMVQISETFWLRIPVGKLHNDRYVPLHPILVDLITDYRATRGTSRSATSSSAMTVSPSTAGPFTATSPRWPSGPASATSTPISSATPWPPRQSIGA